MSFTIELGWWLAPLAVTLVGVAIAKWIDTPDGNAYGYAAIGAGLVSGFVWMIWLIVTLASWLVWAVLT